MKRGRDDGWRRKGGEGERKKGREKAGGGGVKALYSMFCDGATAQYKTHFFTQVL